MIDPIRREIIRGAIRAAQAEMDALLERTAIRIGVEAATG